MTLAVTRTATQVLIDNDANNTAQITFTGGTMPTAGIGLVVPWVDGVATNPTVDPTIADNQGVGNVYVKATSNTETSGGQLAGVWYCAAIGAVTDPFTITITRTAASGSFSVTTCSQVNGPIQVGGTATSVRQTAGTGFTLTGPSFAGTDGLNYACMTIDSSNANNAIACATAYTSALASQDTANHLGGSADFKLVSAATNAVYSYASGSTDAVGVLVTFIPAAATVTSLGRDLKQVGPGPSPNKIAQFVSRPLASGPPSALGTLAGTLTLLFGASAQLPAGVGRSYVPGPGLSPDYRFVFRPVQLGFSAGTTTGVLAGTSALTFSQTGALVGAGALAASIPLTFAITGSLDASAGALTGNTSLVLGQTGTLVGAGSLAGTTALTLGSNTTLVGAGVLAGTSTLVFSQTGDLGSGGQLLGTSTLVFGQTGALTGVGAMAGTASLTLGGTSTIQAVGALIGTLPLLFQLTAFNGGVSSGSPGSRHQLGFQFFPNH